MNFTLKNTFLKSKGIKEKAINESLDSKDLNKRRYFKIPPAPILPKKRLSDEAQVLTNADYPKNFALYIQRMIGCFRNLDLTPEPDIEDALNSLNILINGKNKILLYKSQFFAIMTKMAIDLKKEIPNELRRSLVNLI